jgi:hypothetical protein
MSETKHSPEPWRIDKEDPASGIGDAAGEICAEGWGRKRLADANARRIVACVNALAGISTEALESGALAKALDLWAEYRRLMETDGVVPETMVEAVHASLRALGRLKP